MYNRIMVVNCGMLQQKPNLLFLKIFFISILSFVVFNKIKKKIFLLSQKSRQVLSLNLEFVLYKDGNEGRFEYLL